jgi:uncharacterized protein
MVDMEKIHSHVMKKLEGLSSHLTYHNVGHTLDVLKQCVVIAKEEGITSKEDLMLLQVSALYHDVGFLEAYDGHEERSCQIATKELGKYGLTPDQIEKVCGMIRCTKIPQSPANVLEKIICDADLDYLGRPDFYTIGDGLFREFKHQGIIKNELEWNQLQVRFLEKHHYYTKSCIDKREKVKQRHLEEVRMKTVDDGR